MPKRAAVLLGVLLAVAAAVTLAVRWGGTERDRTASVAVLPFASDREPETRYFGNGFHDTLVSQLSRIQGLRVIARGSVLEYRDGPRDLARIGRELGVDHLVEGEVRRAGQRLHVKAWLVAARSGRLLWTATYDRPLSEIFSIQSDVARQVAAAVDGRITLGEDLRLGQVPTRDLDAYELYLRALDVEAQTPPRKDALLEALAWLREALRKDPGFAAAHALASRIHMAIYWVVGEYDKARLPEAFDRAQRALELAPQLADAHLAMALYWYWGHRDYSKALANLEDARNLEPNSSAVSFLAGSIYRRLGRWDSAITQSAWAAQVDPRNARTLQVYVDVLSANREFGKAEEVHESLAAIAPRSALAHYMRLQNLARWTGGGGRLAAEARAFDPKGDPYCLAHLARHELLMLERQFAAAAEAVAACPGDAIGALHNVPTPKEQLAAVAWKLAGDTARAAEQAAAARRRLEERLAARPDLPLTRIGLAYVLAIQGERAAAMAEIDRAVAGMPMAEDAIVGAEVRDHAAALHAYLGEHPRALEELNEALGMAYGSYAQLVRRNALWDPLRDDPRFRQLVAGHMPEVPWRRRAEGWLADLRRRWLRS